MVPAPVESAASLSFAAQGQLSGSTGCNSFTGTYTATGSDLRLTLGAMTQKACVSPVLQTQEQALTTQLPLVTTYTVHNGLLTLTGSNGTDLLVYKASSTSLVGTRWKVTGVNNGKGAVVATALTEKLTAAFGAGDAFSGFGGCNELTGPYKLTANRGLSIGPLAATKKTCGTAVNQLEAEYSTALSRASSYELTGNTLTLRDSSNATQITAQRA
jgi:heat shock protein HslJ